MVRSDPIGVMTTRHLNEQGCRELLTPNERARWESLRNDERRKGWLGARLAAKYQFLAALGNSKPDNDASCGSQLSVVDTGALEDFPRWAYREIEILPPPGRVGCSQLTWVGRSEAVCVALSHTAGVAVACLTAGFPLGLDVEVPRPRIPSFYRRNFSPSEQRWVEDCRRSETADPERVYTLLWCLKEAALKSGRSAEASVLEVPLIEVRPLCHASALSPIVQPRRVGTALVNAQVEIRRSGKAATAEAAIAASDEVILVALRGGEEE